MSNRSLPFSQTELDDLFSPKTIRSRCTALYQQALAGKTGFAVHPEKLDEVADFVVQVTRENYPDLKIPFHSRWGHFRAGGVDRVAELDQRLVDFDAFEKARVKLDLVIVSVLLDAGAGNEWRYREKSSGKEFQRSEGLAIASYRMFVEGAFSSNHAKPLQVDSHGLLSLTEARLAQGFQVTAQNPLVGVSGRLALLHELGHSLERDPVRFPSQFGNSALTGRRLGNLLDYFKSRATGKDGFELPAREILQGVLLGLGPIWPDRLKMGDVNLGDVWHHDLLGGSNSSQGLVPFHKLSQWLSYSLMEPLMEAGFRIGAVGELTGLPEYRNGGLFLDSGLLTLRDPGQAQQSHRPGDSLIIEWRALTVVLLDLIAERVRDRLGMSAEDFPLAKVLEGGTWWAGRKIAATKRPGGVPPLKIDSDGTVF